MGNDELRARVEQLEQDLATLKDFVSALREYAEALNTQSYVIKAETQGGPKPLPAGP